MKRKGHHASSEICMCTETVWIYYYCPSKHSLLPPPSFHPSLVLLKPPSSRPERSSASPSVSFTHACSDLSHLGSSHLPPLLHTTEAPPTTTPPPPPLSSDNIYQNSSSASSRTVAGHVLAYFLTPLLFFPPLPVQYVSDHGGPPPPRQHAAASQTPAAEGGGHLRGLRLDPGPGGARPRHSGAPGRVFQPVGGRPVVLRPRSPEDRSAGTERCGKVLACLISGGAVGQIPLYRLRDSSLW